MTGGIRAKSQAAFDQFRAAHALRPMRITPTYEDQKLQMGEADGLELWKDGPANPNAAQGVAPMLTLKELEGRIRLWAVRPADVPHASEDCLFGRNLNSGVIKHSNLTAGDPAHCAGELVLLDAETVLLNGYSGRYGPESADELRAIGKAFKGSGYNIWCMAFDDEQGRSLPFGSSTPQWVP